MFLNLMIKNEYDIFVLFLKKYVLLISTYTKREGGVVGEASGGSSVLDSKMGVQILGTTSKGT